MDGDTPVAGDSVHDILVGQGFVDQVHSDGSITVRFGQRTMQYSPTGHYGTVRRLYWEDPVIVIPRRREGLTKVLRSLAQIVRSDRVSSNGSP